MPKAPAFSVTPSVSGCGIFHRPAVKRLCDPRIHHIAGDIGQPEIASAMVESELLVVEAHEVQNRGVEIVDMHLVPRHGAPVWIACSKREAGFYTASVQSGRENLRVVFASFRACSIFPII
jgi:hypothetical protein